MVHDDIWVCPFTSRHVDIFLVITLVGWDIFRFISCCCIFLGGANNGQNGDIWKVL